MTTVDPIRVAIATCSKHPNLYAEEAKLPAALAKSGLAASPVCWNDPGVDWTAFDAVLIRSTWDYVQRAPQFRAWLDELERQSVPLLNPAALVRWNLDKRYLAELAAKGTPIVPTVFLNAPEDFAAILESKAWPRAVLKPAISAGSHRTVRFAATDARAHQALADELASGPGALIQPYLPEIETAGELSFLFFSPSSRDAVEFAVSKRPAAGDFRVQFTFGGTFERVRPGLPDEGHDEKHTANHHAHNHAQHWAAARAVLEALTSRPAYARVDGVVLNGAFHLMEVELIEPYLYLAAAPDLFDDVARALAAAIRSAAQAGYACGRTRSK